MNWFRSGLNRRFALGTAAGLLVSSLCFLLLFVGFYRAELTEEKARAAAQVTGLLQSALENAMLKRDLEGLRFIVERLGRQPNVAAVFITNPDGEVRFASEPGLLGRRFTLVGERNGPHAEFLGDEQGRSILRSVHPVANRPACRECHGPVEQRPINGVLFVDYDAASIRSRARATTLWLMAAGAAVLLLNLAGGWWFLRRYVVGPVTQLGSASGRLAGGDLGARVDLSADDELGQLGRSFNAMAEQLQAKVGELDRQREFLQALVDAIPDGVRVIGPDFRVRLANRAYRQQLLLGEGEDLALPCHQAAHGSVQPCAPTLITCPVHEFGRDAAPLKTLHRHQRSDGEALDVEIYAAPLRATLDGREQALVVESIRDLSQQVSYSHEQKLSEIGKLATGVAHEIHNPLASIRLALDAILGDAEGGMSTEVLRDYLDVVDREIEQCIAVTDRLLRMGVPPGDAPELVDAGTAFADTLSLVRWEAEQGGVGLCTELPEGLRVLAADGQLRMVALNLIQNAIHAMPEGGTLTVSGGRHAGWVELVVEDTGVGIAPEQQRRVFDPFYSRRADGSEGAGLGLPIVRTIVEGYGGEIGLESEPGRGTRFVVRLPDPERDGEGGA